MARPSDFTQATADIICQRLASGESLRAICRDEEMPGSTTIFRWLASDEEAYKGFREQYARAREAQADALADEILEISDDGTNDWMERKNADGSIGDIILNGEHVQRSRLRVDARKWYAGKVAPKKYGDKLTAELSGPNGGKIETVTEIRRTIVRPGS